MVKSLVLWELVPDTLPKDPAEQGKLFAGFMQIVQKYMGAGITTDWGIFSGGGAGYSITEGTPEQGLEIALQYSPYVKFDVRSVLTAAETAKVLKSLSG